MSGVMAKPWTIIIIACVVSALLFALNEIFASGSEKAVTAINVLFLLLVTVAVAKSFESAFSKSYKVSIWVFAFLVFAAAGYGLSMKFAKDSAFRASQDAKLQEFLELERGRGD